MPKNTKHQDVTYTIKSGDTLSQIARSHNMSFEKLLSIPGNEKFVPHPDLIKIGEIVHLGGDQGDHS